MRTSASALRELIRIRGRFSEPHTSRKLQLLRALSRPLTSARRVLDLHETLCFLRAYPDDDRLLFAVERMLASFDRRSDLRHHRTELADSGIDGTAIHYRFFWPMARWLALRWPERLHLEPSEDGDRLKAALALLVTWAEASAIKRSDEEPQDILQRLCGEQTDAAFLLERMSEMPGDDFTREALHDGIDSSYRLDPGPNGPSRTRAKHDTRFPLVFQKTPLRRERPDVLKEMKRPPLEVRAAAPSEARRLIDLACEAMVTRSRDLEVFLYGDPRDVRMVIDHDGLAFAVIGFVPERRLLMRAAYGLLTLKNGVPIGYVQADALFHSAEIAFNTFDTFRGGESAWVFGRLLSVVNHLFAAPSFSIEPYQLGYDNEEGLESGAWWFYYKFGFRPRDRAVQHLVAKELARMTRDPDHRSDRRILSQLAARHLYFNLDPARQPVEADLSRLGWSAAEHRDRFDREIIREAASHLGIRSWSPRTAGERLALERWCPILLSLENLSRWTAGERQRAAVVVMAKGGTRESDYVRRFDAHPKLARAIAEALPAAQTSRVSP